MYYKGMKRVLVISVIGLLLSLPVAPREGEDPLEAVRQAVVSIWGVWDLEGSREALCYGTGFLLNDQGYVVTNDHVLKTLLEEADPPAQAIEVGLSDGSVRPAQIMAQMPAPDLDLALLKIEPPVPAHVLLGNPQVLPEGKQDGVKVIGFPAAYHIGCSATDLAITGGQLVNRQAQLPGGFSVSFSVPPQQTQVEVKACSEERVLALQAGPSSPIAVPGSSGSPVVNESGQVVGILCGGEEVYSDRFKVVRAYAIPVDLALEKFEALSGLVPPHAPEIVGVNVPGEVDEGQELEVQISFWDVNGDLEKVEFIADSPSSLPVPDPQPVPPEAAEVRSGEFTVKLPVPEGVIIQPPRATVKVVLCDGAGNCSDPRSFDFKVIPLIETIQRAIDRVPESECQEVIIPARTYFGSLEVRNKQCVFIRGEGRGETIIVGNGDDPVIFIQIEEDDSTERTKVTLEGLTLQGGSSGVDIMGEAQVELRDVKLVSNSDGASIEDRSKVTIINSSISRNEVTGITATKLSTVELKNVTLSENFVGIIVDKRASVQLQGLTKIINNESTGLVLQGKAKVRTTAGIEISGNEGSGLVISNSATAKLYGGLIQDNRHGIHASGRARPTISGITITRNEKDGILLADFVNAVIEKAKITGNQGWGVALWVAECHPEAGGAEFKGTVSGSGNTITDNGQALSEEQKQGGDGVGDVCPGKLEFLKAEKR